MQTNEKWVTRSPNSKPIFKEDWYLAQLISIVPISSPKYGENLSFKFQLNDGLIYMVSSAKILFPGNTKTNPSKFFNIACAILGKKLEEGEVISIDNLIGSYCLVKVTEEKKNGRSFQKITDFNELSKEQIESLKKNVETE